MCYTHNEKDWFSLKNHPYPYPQGWAVTLRLAYGLIYTFWLDFNVGNLDDDNKSSITIIRIEAVTGVQLIMSGFYVN